MELYMAMEGQQAFTTRDLKKKFEKIALFSQGPSLKLNAATGFSQSVTTIPHDSVLLWLIEAALSAENFVMS